MEFKKAPDHINSIIGEGTLLKGEINSSGSLYVNGSIEGNVNAQSDVFISEKGKVSGNISGARVIISGTIIGDIIANKGLEISKTGRVKGSISCDKLLLEAGAEYSGRVNVGTRETPQEVEDEVKIVIEEAGFSQSLNA